MCKEAFFSADLYFSVAAVARLLFLICGSTGQPCSSLLPVDSIEQTTLCAPYWNRRDLSADHGQVKAVLSVLGHGVRETIASDQLYAGQKGGCEAAVHALRNSFESESLEAILFVDAKNASTLSIVKQLY